MNETVHRMWQIGLNAYGQAEESVSDGERGTSRTAAARGGGVESVASGQSLHTAGTSEANLQGADLSGADLREARPHRGSTSAGRSLREAQPTRGSTSSRARLTRARLTRVDLTMANLADADLAGANLSEGAFLFRSS